MSTRTEHDTMGNVEVPSEAYWGRADPAQPQQFQNPAAKTLPQPLTLCFGAR